VGYDKRRDKYGMRKRNTLKVDVVGENAKRRRLMVVAIFIPKLANTNSGKKPVEKVSSIKVFDLPKKPISKIHTRF
jgi:hypothetical protein